MTLDERRDHHAELTQEAVSRLSRMMVGQTIEIGGRKIRRVSESDFSAGGPSLSLASMAGWMVIYQRTQETR